MFSEDVEYAADNVVGPLVGFKVTGVALDKENQSYGLVLTKGKSKKIAWIDCDPEGNGPGWLQVENV